MTERQRQVLEFIAAYLEMKGFAPSMQDIALGLGLKSRSNIHRVVHDLRDLGMVRLSPGRVRTIKLIDQSVDKLIAL